MLETLLIYNAILLAACAAAFCVRCAEGWQEWMWRTILLLVMLLPAALRYNIGTDYANYVNYFNAPDGAIQRTEIGFLFLNQVVMAMEGSVQWMFALVALLTYLPLAFGLRRNRILPVVVLYMLTLYLSSFSAIRQMLDISWVLVALTRYLDDNRIGHAYFWIAAASFFHLSALIVLPFVLIRKVHIPAWFLLLLMPAFYFIATHGFIDFLFSSDVFLGTKYGGYANSQYDHKTEMGSGLGVLLRMLIPLAYMVYSGRLERKNDIVLYTVVAYVVSYMLSIQVHIFNRLVDTFSFAPILAFGVMSKELKKRLALLILFALMLINFEKTIVANTSDRHGGLGITPYVTIFDAHL